MEMTCAPSLATLAFNRLPNGIKYTFYARIRLESANDNNQQGIIVLQNEKAIENTIGFSGLNKLSPANGSLLQGETIEIVLYHEDWTKSIAKLAAVDYGCENDLELNPADYRDISRMSSQEQKQRLLMLRISKPPDPGKHDWSTQMPLAPNIKQL